MNKIIDVMCELSPIILSIIMLVLIKIKKGNYWQSKVENQMSNFELDDVAIKQVIEITDDISTSIGFVGAICSILLGIILIILGELLDKKTFSSEFAILLLLMVVYIGALIQLFRMKDVLLSRKCRMSPLRRFSYANIFNGLLYFGYLIIIGIIFKIQCST
jgi:hypothetical protein